MLLKKRWKKSKIRPTTTTTTTIWTNEWGMTQRRKRKNNDDSGYNDDEEEAYEKKGKALSYNKNVSNGFCMDDAKVSLVFSSFFLLLLHRFDIQHKFTLCTNVQSRRMHSNSTQIEWERTASVNDHASHITDEDDDDDGGGTDDEQRRATQTTNK